MIKGMKRAAALAAAAAVALSAAYAANNKAAFISPTAGTGVNFPSMTSTWNGATYQAPVQASVVEPEAGHIGNMTLSTSYAQLSGCSANVTRGYKVKNTDAAIDVKISTQASPSATQTWTLKAGDVIVIDWANVCSLYFAGASGTPVVQWIGY